MSLQDDFKNAETGILHALERGATDEVAEFLQASEQAMRLSTATRRGARGPAPAQTRAAAPAAGVRGDPAFGVIPYYLHHPPQKFRLALQALGPVVRRVVERALAVLAARIPTSVNPAEFEALLAEVQATGGWVLDDGSLLGLGKYEDLDPGWLWKFANNYFTHTLGPQSYQFPSPDPLPLAGRQESQVTLALTGDFGTGAYAVGTDDPDGPAVAVMQQLLTLQPDYVLHLGDVYYTGTPASAGLADLPYNPHREVEKNFLALWPGVASLAEGRSFALNGNHEMYSGGRGYFRGILGDPRFATQGSASSFALTFAGWTLLGLDSAYWDPSPMRNTGSLGGPANPQQANWVRSLGLDPARTIALTHHNPVNTGGTCLTTYPENSSAGHGVWQELADALGGAPPAAWYFGHNHQGIVYASLEAAPGCRLRCAGHAAMPHGDTDELQQALGQTIDYYGATPNPFDPRGLMTACGFALLTLHQDGTVEEEFFEQNYEGNEPVSRFRARYGPGGQPA